MSDDVVIRVDGLWKRYGLPLPEFYHKSRHWLRTLRHGANGDTPDDGPWALRDVSFEVKRGETLGIIGRNGAGKSTLLKVLAGVTPPTRGKVDVRGRIFPMIELNAGMHMELTGRENVYLLGAVMGMRRAEVNARLPAIEEFCELGEWFERPVRMYSSGMLARLGFGVAMNVEPDVIFVDEVLAVGDLLFQRKCMDRLEHMRMNGVTTVFVSHSMRQIERICDYVILLTNGQISKIGNSTVMVNEYYAFSIKTEADMQSSSDLHWTGTGEVIVSDVKYLSQNGVQISDIISGESSTILLTIDSRIPVNQLVIAVAVVSIDMVTVTAFSNVQYLWGTSHVGIFEVSCEIEDVFLLPGNYTLKVKIVDQHGVLLYGSERVSSFSVLNQLTASILPEAGLVRTKVKWRYKRMMEVGNR